jgi:hypothetical protein
VVVECTVFGHLCSITSAPELTRLANVFSRFSARWVKQNVTRLRARYSNYESAWTWDIFLLPAVDEMLNESQESPKMANNDYLDEVHVRMLRVTEDLRAIQQELNCAAMQAPNDPELMESLARLPEIESLEMLKSALDQMRHFLWFYVQVMTTGPEAGEKLQHGAKKMQGAPTDSTADKLNSLADAALLRHFASARNRKPN